MTRARSVLLAALIVCSAVIGAVGPALAQSTETDTPQSGTTTLEFNGGENILVVDTTDMSGTVTVTFSTQGTPGSGSQPLVREEVDTTTTDGVALANLGAYETVTATVEGEGTPTTSTHGGRLGTPDGYTMLGGTGGDADLQCGVKEKIAQALDAGFTQLDCTAQPGTTTVNTTGTDALQVETDLYQAAQNDKAAFENTESVVNNRLQDAQTQALIVGQNAYIKSLNNGSSQSAATTEAKTAQDDYYAVAERNVIAEWNRQVADWKYRYDTAQSESGLQAGGVVPGQESQDSPGSANVAPNVASTSSFYPDNGDTITLQGTTTKQYTLVNGSTVQVTGLQFLIDDGGDGSGASVTLYPDEGTKSGTDSGGNFGATIDGLATYDEQNGVVTTAKVGKYSTMLSTVQTQHSDANSQIQTVVDNTYTEYQSGEINNSDLVDPYVLASQQSPGDDFQGWAAAQLTLIGTNSPDNFDQIGSFNVTTESGQQYEGVLFSQENPTSGQFENGTTYDTANIGGTQYVVTSDQIVELDGTFTIDKITTTSGETTKNVTIQKTTYETTNVTELKQQYEDLAYRRAQIEAREKALQQSAGGGLLGGGSVPPVVALAVIGTLLGIVVLQN
ncbi:hypothetical protein [Haloarcula sp. CGMCC 1.6347]|uniref:hypothetical protein n=1 Tax=Haloarcula sp. CGMCC 1.6347 TaxID=3111455 RepID=UPI00300F5C82